MSGREVKTLVWASRALVVLHADIAAAWLLHSSPLEAVLPAPPSSGSDCSHAMASEQMTVRVGATAAGDDGAAGAAFKVRMTA